MPGVLYKQEDDGNMKAKPKHVSASPGKIKENQHTPSMRASDSAPRLVREAEMQCEGKERERAKRMRVWWRGGW